uniref:Niban apoptosis regulator 2 n=1 Tax=Anas platyrhynchos platyrhynchos TaxID=8840 RepID=A0A493TGY2_ANAPP
MVSGQPARCLGCLAGGCGVSPPRPIPCFWGRCSISCSWAVRAPSCLRWGKSQQFRFRRTSGGPWAKRALSRAVRHQGTGLAPGFGIRRGGVLLAAPVPASRVTVGVPPAGPAGGPRHLLGEPLPVHRGEQEVEEPLLRGAAQLRPGALREQTGLRAGAAAPRAHQQRRLQGPHLRGAVPGAGEQQPAWKHAPGVAPKSGNAAIIKCPTDFPLILWHPYARHYYFCVMTGKEQEKWGAVFQDCVRHCNNGISEDSKVEAPAFTDAVRMYRQSKEQYGTWDMLCGNQSQILSNLVMEELLPELRSAIGPRLKGKAPERQRAWIQISDAVYRMVYEQTQAQYDALVAKCEAERPQLESTIRTDMDQIITSKEHLCSKIRAFVLPKAEICVRNHVQPYISSILEALMTPTSQGFAEVREVFFKEVTDMNMNIVNEGGLEKLVEYMEKLSHLAFHPVKMQSCYEKMEQLKLEGLQQRFDVSSTSVFKQRAQIHMRQQMDDAVYTFETLLHQELGKLQGKDDLCKSIQRILERVLKKYDYDSSTVRKKFFREALLQITIPFLLKKLAPTCKGELAKFQELIFEDFASFILVENTYEEVVLQSVMKDIMQAVKEAAVQRKHNLYRDSMVMHNSDPNLHLLGEGIPIDWAEEHGGQPEAEPAADKRRRAKQVVSVIQDDEGALPYEAGAEGLLPPSSPEPAVPPGSPGEAEERLTNGTHGRRQSGATEELRSHQEPRSTTPQHRLRPPGRIAPSPVTRRRARRWPPRRLAAPRSPRARRRALLRGCRLSSSPVPAVDWSWGCQGWGGAAGEGGDGEHRGHPTGGGPAAARLAATRGGPAGARLSTGHPLHSALSFFCLISFFSTGEMLYLPPP